MNPRYTGWVPPRPGRLGVDLDGAVCAFQSNNCTTSMIGAGGLDEHHEWPVSMGGDERQADNTMLLLCPNHHRRAHALLRYMVENDPLLWNVLRHFTAVEIAAAQFAVEHWRADGSPKISGWSAPAARDA